ncbi:MAG: extracellular solute-binding protein [Clostridium sp.]|jgi:ABC-type glycerol-3-phosphate transport system substrate-binding protein|nr:extracellular solute-binding protein [Clostridium sp.]
MKKLYAKGTLQKIIFLSSIALVIIAWVLISKLTQPENYQDKYEGFDLTQSVFGLSREGTYSQYMMDHADAKHPTAQIDIDLQDYIEGVDVEASDLSEGALFTGDQSTVTWEVDVPEAGFYNVQMDYFTVESRGVEIERTIYINGELPFTDAQNIAFTRLWTDAGPVRIDNQGNEIRSAQVEAFEWQSAFFKDDMGFIVEPYQFYFDKGVNTITIESVNEPMIIGSLSLCGVKPETSYVDYQESLSASAATGEGLTYVTKIQGESARLRSEPSLYAKYDRAAPNTEPYSVTKTLMNYIGGTVWSTAGQWIQWDFEVPENGFYKITIKGRQNYDRGLVSGRSLYIDGVIPFDEVQSVYFTYDNAWNMMTLSDDEGEPYRFYLEKGSHTMRLEVSLGQMGAYLEEIEDSIYRSNQIYRKLLIYLGATPDQYRDYLIDQVYPEVMEAMEIEYRRLYKIVDDVVGYVGQKGDKIAAAQTLAKQMERFVKRPDRIPAGFTNFKENITSVGTALLQLSTSQLDIDYIVVSGEKADIPEDSANAFEAIAHEVKSFAASFVVDYDSVGDVYDEDDEEVVKIWIITGRDQGTILKSMVDDTFTPETGIKVNVEIVNGNALLNAVVADRGPNIVISAGPDLPVNYALRHATEDLTQFEGLEETLANFNPSAYRAYQFNGGIYALPETQTYSVLYYRSDILEELGLTVPNTWDELIAMLPTIQGSNMTVAIPSPSNVTADNPSAAPDLSMLYTLIYQNGSDIYNDDGTHTIIDSEEGVDAFRAYTRYFNDYGMPAVYDFVNRFRSGEMPIGISNFNTYNTLMVAAPEIKGLWDFTLVPGTERTNEAGETYIDRSVYSTGVCTMMIRTKEQSIKDKAWEFMQWWAEPDTQARFGREQEALLGSSARYAAASPEAARQIGWSSRELEVLEAQREYTVGFREVAGGYYTPRHITNAARKVMAEKADPRETLLEYSITIDEELLKKRQEFGLE